MKGLNKLLVAALCASLCVAGGSDASAKSIVKKPAPKFAEFSGDPSGLPVRFQYPEQWKLAQEQGTVERFHLVRIQGPRNPEKTYTSYFSVTVSPTREQGGRFGNLAEIVKNYKDTLLPDSKIESEGLTVVGGQGAVELVVSAVLKPSFHSSLKSIPIPVKTRTFFTHKGNMLYQITYGADSRVYKTHAKKFDRLLQSFQFE